ncbi:NAD(P)-dependent oxidoreductase [Actinophytocola sp.]|uniref:NAD(P)-dependent oxidoreductase n=1 Tax=Actinophytocola sp. TaxID=1872138 RepID=UPI002D7E7E6D|nr:NAD(P)-dependent oxidoreductase [Actinophytocola sp.]HET9137991.1 NAD(P)-dependent oxidoreductase [Actinophytocola sp.]
MAADPVAVVGAGTMGAAMAATLCRAGRKVLLYNRTRERAERVAERTGASVAGSAREAAAAGLVLVSLADDDAARSVYSGPNGLVAGLRAGSVVLETSTVAPDTVRELAALAAERGAVLLDAPVSGSVALVERGELTFMVGGDPAALERAAPVLDILGRRTFHLGGQGSGSVMKLAVNSALHGLNQALAEALVLAESAGLDRSAAYEVFASSALAAPFVLYKRAAYEHPETTPPAFTLGLVAKDLALVAGLADEVGVAMTQLAANRQVVGAALDAGLGAADMSALATFLRDAR